MRPKIHPAKQIRAAIPSAGSLAHRFGDLHRGQQMNSPLTLAWTWTTCNFQGTIQVSYGQVEALLRAFGMVCRFLLDCLQDLAPRPPRRRMGRKSGPPQISLNGFIYTYTPASLSGANNPQNADVYLQSQWPAANLHCSRNGTVKAIHQIQWDDRGQDAQSRHSVASVSATAISDRSPRSTPPDVADVHSHQRRRGQRTSTAASISRETFFRWAVG